MYQLGLGTYTPEKLFGGEPFTSSCPESRQDGLKMSHLDTEVTGKGEEGHRRRAEQEDGSSLGQAGLD